MPANKENYIKKNVLTGKTIEQHPVYMLDKMYEKIQGMVLLLEALQPTEKSKNREDLAFKTLVATILSVRTRDETALIVIEKLWKIYNTPKDIAEAPIETLEKILFSTGTYKQKARFVQTAAKIIHEKYNDIVPQAIDKLMAIPGIGRKVAQCIRSISYDIPCIAVDTHVHRISNIIGWVKTKNPEETERALMELFPKERWQDINYTLVSFGKKICKPRQPLCEICPIKTQCIQDYHISPPKTNPNRNKKEQKEILNIKKGLIQTTAKNATILGVLIRKEAEKIVKAIEEKNKRLSRRTEGFINIFNQRKEISDGKILYLPIGATSRAFKRIMDEEGKEFKKNIKYYYLQNYQK